MLEINRIYNMDCVEGVKLLDDASVDLTVTSPPTITCANTMAVSSILKLSPKNCTASQSRVVLSSG